MCAGVYTIYSDNSFVRLSASGSPSAAPLCGLLIRPGSPSAASLCELIRPGLPSVAPLCELTRPVGSNHQGRHIRRSRTNSFIFTVKQCTARLWVVGHGLHVRNKLNYTRIYSKGAVQDCVSHKQGPFVHLPVQSIIIKQIYLESYIIQLPQLWV